MKELQDKFKEYEVEDYAQAGAKARWWTYGNGQGSEKWDGFEEAARFTNSQDEFDSKVALQGNFIPNVNAHDDEPTTHPMGYSFIQKGKWSSTNFKVISNYFLRCF